MTRDNEVAVIIPVYNEAQVIVKTIQEVEKQFKNIICVNDGSKDTSSIEIAKTSAKLVEHPINMGQGAALQTGIEYALRDHDTQYFVTFDADGQHDIQDVKRMIGHIKKSGVDVVLGSRFLGKAENISKLKRLILKAAVKFSNATSGVKLTDAHNGLRVFNRRVAENLNITMPDMAHASEIIHRIAEHEFKYEEMPITIAYTDYSKAKGQSMMNAFNISFDVLLQRLTKK
jgi:glycosyltransferase involved in cell wall biosynthesis